MSIVFHLQIGASRQRSIFLQPSDNRLEGTLPVLHPLHHSRLPEPQEGCQASRGTTASWSSTQSNGLSQLA